MTRRSSLDTLRDIRERALNLQRVALAKGLRVERSAAQQHLSAAANLEAAKQQVQKERQQTSAHLQDKGMRGFEGQQQLAWQQGSRSKLRGLAQQSEQARANFQQAKAQTLLAQASLAKASTRLDQVKKKLAQIRLADWLRQDAADHDAQEDRSLHSMATLVSGAVVRREP